MHDDPWSYHAVEWVLVLVGKWNGGQWIRLYLKTGMPAAVEWQLSLAPQHGETVYSRVVIEAALELGKENCRWGVASE